MTVVALTIDEHWHRLSVEDYLRLSEDGHLGRTELIEGVIYDLSPESVLHADAVHAVCRRLEAALPGCRVRQNGSIVLGDNSLWEPDVYVTDVDPVGPYPGAAEVVLAVEVAVSTLRRDLGGKGVGYARNGVAEYWVLVPQVGGYVVRQTDPGPDGYRQVERIELPGGYADIDVADLLSR